MGNFKKRLEELNLDKQIEKMAIRYYKKKNINNKIFNKEFNEFIKDKDNLKILVEEYLDENPKMKKEYEEKKRNQKKLKIIGAVGAIGALTAATIIGANKLKPEDEPIIEKTNIEESNNEEEEKEENISEYDEFFEMIENDENAKIRNDIILQQTKEIIVEAYNMQNPNNQITANRLEILILNGFVIQKTDRLGNITYERKDKGVNYELPDNESIDRMEFYVFSIDGKNVGTYFTNGDRLEDDTIEKEEKFFASTVNLMNQYQKLIENFKYSTNEYLTNIAENNFEEQANKLLEEKALIKQVQQELEH